LAPARTPALKVARNLVANNSLRRSFISPGIDTNRDDLAKLRARAYPARRVVSFRRGASGAIASCV